MVKAEQDEGHKQQQQQHDGMVEKAKWEVLSDAIQTNRIQCE